MQHLMAYVTRDDINIILAVQLQQSCMIVVVRPSAILDRITSVHEEVYTGAGQINSTKIGRKQKYLET